MIIAAPSPPAIHAPEKPCAYDPAAKLFDEPGFGPTTVFSPDCRWQLRITGVDKKSGETEGALYDLSTGKKTHSFQISGWATPHWYLADGLLILNNRVGADGNELMVFRLAPEKALRAPISMADLLGKDFEKRVNVPRRLSIYHFYMSLDQVSATSIKVSVLGEYVGHSGPDRKIHTYCLVYRIDKATFRRPTLVSRPAPGKFNWSNWDQ